MEQEAGLEGAAALFKVLGSESRLRLLRLLVAAPATVGSLVEQSAMSQPLVSQHLRTLRQADIVTVSRTGREAEYQLADHHISHVIDDAIAHVREDHTPTQHQRAVTSAPNKGEQQ
ncbi:helix-turn-helix transcriptional regulator [Agreia sp. COWG]|uniref:ArsR/SmtB family transcription factor n=1 Tax=Agreia sp. COWG TaxID=2773266 RepID=UPI00192587D4|nr:metalloregulator ArsR/SmtB family transcription factor [Agreia sp. COWG]CAD5990195.1 ArsR family transcriptional regulator [Agreia sp. COWG]